MKIKLMILCKDDVYLSRLSNALEKYANNLELYLFSSYDNAKKVLENNNIDVFLAETNFDIDLEQIPYQTKFVYLVKDSSVDKYENIEAVGEYQSVSEIYKKILSFYAENSKKEISIKNESSNNGTKTIAFTSFAGGVGTSSVAAACAINFAEKGKKVIYLNFENFQSGCKYFSGTGDKTLSDVILSIKSKKNSLMIKIGACIKRDKSGVLFFDEAKPALEMNDFSKEERWILIDELVKSDYDYIIIDESYDGSSTEFNHFAKYNEVVLVSDGSETTNHKFAVALESIALYEDKYLVDLINKLSIVYNKFSNKTSLEFSAVSLKSLGGSPRFEHTGASEVTLLLSQKSIFNEIM